MNSEASICVRGSQAAVICLLLIAFSISSSYTPAQAEDLSFSWRTNPVEELISSYRLYYGPESRYEPPGIFSPKSGFSAPQSISPPKNGFSYEYYIDLALELRCPADSCDYNDCEQLTPGTVSCQEAYGTEGSEYLQCTVLNLPSRSYYTLTAYNDFGEEGDYSVEVTNVEPTVFVGNISFSTTEFGWTAFLGLALSVPPADDVTINLSSDDPLKGTIYPASVILNADNLIRFVHVVWSGDPVVDGAVEYKIITAPAESLDVKYAGIDPDDFVIVN